MSQLVASERDLDMTSLALQQVSQRRPSAVPSLGQVRDLRWEAQLREDTVDSNLLKVERRKQNACQRTGTQTRM